MSEEFVPGKTCWLKAELRSIGEDGLLHLVLHNIVSFTFGQASVPALEVARKHVRQHMEPVIDLTTLASLIAKLEERKMCLFHVYSTRCQCFHCQRVGVLEELIRVEKEKLE